MIELDRIAPVVRSSESYIYTKAFTEYRLIFMYVYAIHTIVPSKQNNMTQHPKIYCGSFSFHFTLKSHFCKLTYLCKPLIQIHLPIYFTLVTFCPWLQSMLIWRNSMAREDVDKHQDMLYCYSPLSMHRASIQYLLLGNHPESSKLEVYQNISSW